MIDAQCPFDRACINQKCVDPCPGICGLNAMCRAVNHNPICTCLPGYNGDPFDRCSLIPEPSKPNSCQSVQKCILFYIHDLQISFFNNSSVNPKRISLIQKKFDDLIRVR